MLTVQLCIIILYYAILYVFPLLCLVYLHYNTLAYNKHQQ